MEDDGAPASVWIARYARAASALQRAFQPSVSWAGVREPSRPAASVWPVRSQTSAVVSGAGRDQEPAVVREGQRADRPAVSGQNPAVFAGPDLNQVDAIAVFIGTREHAAVRAEAGRLGRLTPAVGRRSQYSARGSVHEQGGISSQAQH